MDTNINMDINILSNNNEIDSISDSEDYEDLDFDNKKITEKKNVDLNFL